jgi:cytochrome c oxidase subunit II
MSTPRAIALLSATLLLGGCEGAQTMLSGDGAETRSFLTLFAIFMAVTTFMYLIVIAAMLVAILRRRRTSEALTVETSRHHQSSPLMKALLIGWTSLIVVGLIVLTLASFLTDRSMAAAVRADPEVTVTVTAHQWWWDVQYTGAEASNIIRTANELHLPVGVTAQITLRSNDVIHSFWVPNLAGKQDLIPGRLTDIQLLPRNKGQYRGQCAEFCGIQHANMALDVTVESREDFDKWVAAQQRPAQAPRTPAAMAGYNYVTTRECSVCHNITGTPASGKIAPDLTHVASRKNIAAGTLPMRKGHLYGWIADPQSQKPGNHMPTVGLSSGQLHSIVAYLESLK